MGKRKLVITAVILGLLLIAIAAVAIIRSLGSNPDPYVSQDTSDQSSQEESPAPQAEASNETPDASQNQTTIDPATVSTVDIAPMGVTVSYVKGIGGFEYEVLRTPNGSQYVEFLSPELIGTKCTNDKGVFASILEGPTTGENASINKEVTVDGTKYGLSLAAANCTSDAAKLQSYQQSFNDAFSLLKKLN